MPNGRPDFAETELPLLEQFFAPVAECLERFALDHNLMLTRYWHQEHCWDFMFRHPLAGVGRIMVHRGGEALSVTWLWWVDRYDEFARHLRRTAARAVKRDPADLAPVLREAFAEVLGWREGDLDEVVRGYKEVWSRAGKEALEGAVEYYPIPRVL